MKKSITLVLFVFSYLAVISQQADDPRRGMYVDKFVNYTSTNYLTAFSILGVDDDLNGIFEKEEELLQYAEQNHMTSLTLYDVAKIFSSGAPLVWDNNLSRYATLKEHLCRFMDRARNHYCIKEIYAAVGSTQEATDILQFNQMFNSPSAPFQFTQAEMNSPTFNQRLSDLAQEYSIGDPMLIPSEVAKYVLRALHFSSGNCVEAFDGFTTEFEFWNNGLAQNDIDAGAFEIFMTDLNLIKINYNAVNNPDITINVYYGKKAASTTYVTYPICPAKYVDGCTSSCINTGGYCSNFPVTKLGDRVYFELYYRTTSQLSSYAENIFRDINTTDQTDLHPLFSVENKIGGAPVDFFGRWILDGFGGAPVEIRNIFQAEKEHYVGWKNNNSNGLSSENIIEPGGYEWFTSSYLLAQFKNPPLFYSNAPLCNDGTADFVYIGPREKNIHYTFTITGFAAVSGFTPDFSVNQSDFLPSYNLVNASSPYTATLTLDYGQGCDPVIYTEKIVVGNGVSPTISALGYNTSSINFCEGSQVILKASSGSSYSWKKNGLSISGATNQFYVASEAGIYTCVVGGCGSGASNPITINIDLNPHIFISSLCNTPGPNQMTLTVNNSGVTGSNPGSFIYNWNDGYTGSSNVIGSNHRSNYYVYVTNIYNGCTGYNSISIPSTLPTAAPFSISAGSISCSNGLGSVVLSLNAIAPHPAYDVNNDNMAGIISDGILNRYITWFSSNNLTVSNLPPGHYSVEVNDNGQPCTSVGSFDIGNLFSFTIGSNIISNATCHGSMDGNISITGISGGTSPYTFQWLGIAQSNISNTSNSSTVSNLPAGTYTLKITDQACNFQYMNYIITEPTSLNVTASILPVNCNGFSTGSINQTITGTGITYSWNSGQVTQDISSISAGVYVCTVTQNSCSEDFTYLVNQNPEIGVSVLSTTGTCTSTGLAEVRVYGGSPITSGNTDYILSSPWTLISSADRDEFHITGQSSGNYSITITDNLGCTYTTQVNIPSLPAVTLSLASQTNVNCHGGNNGAATVTASGGTGAYHYSWTGSSSTSPTASGLISNIYICTVTDDAGCSASLSVNITEPLQALTLVLATQTNVSCHGGSNGSANLTAGGGTPNYTFVWSPNVSTTSSISNRPAGTYTCTVTDAHQCTASYTVNITEPPLLVLTPYGSNNTCIGWTNACANANPSGGTTPYTYSWNTFQTTSQICNLNNGTYTVTVTDNKGCTKTGSVSVTTSGICCGNFSNSLPQTISTTNMTAGSNYSDGLNLIFHHEVNSNCVLTNNIIEMEEAQYILVHAGYTLTLNGCTLRACGNMWKGIVLEDGAKIILNNSYIYDAENAIRIIGASDLQISQSHFINNNVGILYEPFNTHSPAVFSIDQSEFRGTGTMKGPYHNQTTVIGSVPQAGIILNNFDINLNSSNNPNVFRRMNSGLVIYDGTVSINNAQFVDIQPDPLIPGNIFDGCGVYDDEPNSSGNSLTFQGYSFPYTNLNFSGCATGIRAEEININISDCNMGASAHYDMETGIHYLYGNTLSSYIANNSINATRYGINMELLDGADQVTVTGNSIGIGNINSGLAVSGIRVSNWGSFNYHGANPKYNIYHNYITLINNVDNGIEFQNVNNFGLIDNHIFPSDNVLQVRGISLSGCHQNEISCNSVESSDPNYSNHDQAGVFAVKSDQNRYGCNTVDNTYNGFLFSLDCASSEIFGNTIKNHYVGLHLDGLGVIGQQPLVYPGSALPGNIWNGNCSQWDAWDENPTTDRYYYNNTTPSSYWQMGPQTFWPPSWFVPAPDRNFECGPYTVTGQVMVDPYCGNGTPDFGGGNGGGSLDERIANNSLQFSSYNTEMIWSLKKYLFEKLKFNQNLLDSDSTFVQFYDSILTTVVGDFGDLKEKENDFFDHDPVTSANVVQKTLLIRSDLAQIGIETDQLNDPNISSSIASTIKQDIASLQSDIETLKNEIGLIVTQQNSGKLIVAGEANDIIQNIVTSETVELNLRDINESYYSIFAQGNKNFSNSQITLWQQIAEQCPVSGGEAVFKARSLYALVNPNVKYDDHLTCLQQGILYRKSQNKQQNNSFKIYPNPTNNSFIFYFSNEDPNSLLNIFDQFGRIVKTINISLHRLSMVVDVSNFNPGIYQVELIQNNSVSFKDRLVIIK